MNRQEHLEWSKQRAIECIKKGSLLIAFASFNSDMSQHEELVNHKALEMGTMMMLGGLLGTNSEMKEWIEGFN